MDTSRMLAQTSDDEDPALLADQESLPSTSQSSLGRVAKGAALLGCVAAAALLVYKSRATSTTGPAEVDDTESTQLLDNVAAVLGRNPSAAEMSKIVTNWGGDCWAPCGKVSGDCPSYCGKGNACCRFKATKDPPECWGVWSWGSYKHHTCVKPVAPQIVQHTTQNCWTDSKSRCTKSGWCDWCGEGNACCRQNWNSDPAECQSVTLFPTNQHHVCVKPTVKRFPTKLDPFTVPATAAVPVVGECTPGSVKSASTGKCEVAKEPELMTFYMYRSQNKDNYKQENVNMASLTGELWYLHNEVVYVCPRKFSLSRLVRYVITMKNPKALWKSPMHYQFGQFVQFDSGQCTWNNTQCETIWNTVGYTVGCQPLDTTNPLLPLYQGPPAPVWYSLPGRCPSKTFRDKTPECLKAEPGGNCHAPDGSFDCTWKVEHAGELTLDELSGITDYDQFCKDGKSEYDKFLDKGNGTTFWDKRRDPIASEQRIQHVQNLYKKKYPEFPASLPDPPCDYWR
eukprot:TRINITY_DN110373_c0_g1_i1.p1 TRINITY_DN110373_c0_g1~~TRINITY_DN110373_c0_g1_i1.p1  ORF type:complete len:531 (+),score=97.78 TRINITY_DN110373_c0_g1_i1:64-1593(+)